MTDITEEAATEVGEESKAEEASVKKERIQSLYCYHLSVTVVAFLFEILKVFFIFRLGRER